MKAKTAVISLTGLAIWLSAISLSMLPTSEKPHYNQREAIERSVAAPLVMEVASDNGAVMTYLNNVTADAVAVGGGGGVGVSGGTVTYYLSSDSAGSGAVMISGGSSGNVTYMAPPKPPKVSISCNDDTCQVLAYDLNGVGENPEEAMASAKAMLEKIANKQVTMDITVIGHTCQKHHEVIPASKPDLVASKD